MRLVTPVRSISTERLIKHCRDSFWLGAIFVLIPSRFEPCGLVDYEPRYSATSSLAAPREADESAPLGGYLYDWLDINDRAGRRRLFRTDCHGHRDLSLLSLRLPSSCIWRWRSMPAGSIRLGSMWTCIAMAFSRNSGIRNVRSSLPNFAQKLAPERELFATFFIPGRQGYRDRLSRIARSAG